MELSPQASGKKISENIFTNSTIAAFFALVIFLIYSNSLNNSFVFDSVGNITENPNIRLREISLKTLKNAAFESHLPTRPVANLTFALNYYFHQFRVFGYHFFNIIIHFINAILLFFLFIKTLKVSGEENPESARLIAMLSVLLWMCHPLHTNTVTYTVQRMNSMASMFYLASLLLYIKARDRRQLRWFFCAFIAFILSLGSKEIAVTLPVFILIYEWLFIQNFRTDWINTRNLVLFSAVILILFIFGFIFRDHLYERIFLEYGNYDYSPYQRVLTESRVVLLYIGLLIYPHPSRLNIDHDFPVSVSFFNPPTTLISLIVILGLMLIAIYKIKSWRILSFSILWYFGHLAIESSIIPLDLVFEHRTYMPSMYLAFLFILFLYRRLKSIRIAAVITIAIALIFSLWTYERNDVFETRVSLWKDCILKSPEKARPYHNLAQALSDMGNTDEAEKYYKIAISKDPDYYQAPYNLGNLYLGKGMPEEAIRYYQKSIDAEPNCLEAINNMGNAYVATGRLKEAKECYQRVIEINPNFTDSRKNLNIVERMMETQKK